MIINGIDLWRAYPIQDMVTEKLKAHGRSYGLSEVGYDFRMKQRVQFFPPDAVGAMVLSHTFSNAGPVAVKIANLEKATHGFTVITEDGKEPVITIGRTALASSVEFFHIPDNLWCEFRNKSTNARHFIDAALGTDGEPGWNGNLTIELVFNGMEPIDLPAGVPILKAVFHEIKNKAEYSGKYQNQPDRPVSAILE